MLRNVLDTTDQYVNTAQESDVSNDGDCDGDINQPSTSSTSSDVNDQQKGICTVCKFERSTVVSFPCKHAAPCSSCWSILKQNFVERIEAAENINYKQLEEKPENDTSYQIPESWLPRCPLCRRFVRTSMEVYVP